MSGYLRLARELYESGAKYGEAWNFGPEDSDAKTVEWIVQKICGKWEDSQGYVVEDGNHPHEASYLKLDCSKAKKRLNWSPRWSLDQALDNVMEWVEAYKKGSDLRSVSWNQIQRYQNSAEVN